MVKNKTIAQEKKNKFWSMHFKAIFFGALWWISRKLMWDKVRPHRSYRGNLLVKSAENIARKKGWKGIYLWQWQQIFAVAHDLSATDNAYECALHETLREYAKLCKKNHVTGWRK